MREGDTIANTQSGAAVSLKDVYQVKADSCNQVIHTGDANETTLKSYTIPGGALGANGVIRFRMTGRATGALGLKTYRLRLGGTQLFLFDVDAGAVGKDWTAYGAIHNQAVEDSQLISVFVVCELTILLHDIGGTKSVDTSTDQDIALSVQLSEAGDTADVREFTIELNPT